jgi:DNA-binding transcriptional regulator YhcF (GntR family)
MFSHAAIASLNNLEMMVYHYVIKNRDKVMYMTIRELAEAAGVSTTTVLRFCRKLQCEGYSEFRVRFKLYLEQNQPQQANIGASEIMSFLKASTMTNLIIYSIAPSILFSHQNVLYLSAPVPPARWQNMAHAFSPTSGNSAIISTTLISRSPTTWRVTRWRSSCPFPGRPKRFSASPASSACITAR